MKNKNIFFYLKKCDIGLTEVMRYKRNSYSLAVEKSKKLYIPRLMITFSVAFFSFFLIRQNSNKNALLEYTLLALNLTRYNFLLCNYFGK